MKPPTVARFLLAAVAGEQEAEFVAGDLHEEFLLICVAQGRPAGSRWYFSQVLRSAAALVRMRFRSGEAAHLLAAALVAVALPLLLLDRLWSFVYSNIPLKDGLQRATGFWLVNVICVSVSAAVCGSLARSIYRAVGVALTSAAASALALWLTVAATPVFFAVVAILAAPASSLIAFAWRRSR